MKVGGVLLVDGQGGLSLCGNDEGYYFRVVLYENSEGYCFAEFRCW